VKVSPHPLFGKVHRCSASAATEGSQEGRRTAPACGCCSPAPRRRPCRRCGPCWRPDTRSSPC
jgi:hypothetical protein